MKGTVSFYGIDPIKEKLNKYTASGEEFKPDELTCALPVSVSKELGIYRQWGTEIKVEYGNKSVVVRYNDTGPNERLKRLCDLTPFAFSKLAPHSVGLIQAEVSEWKVGKWE